MTRAYTLDPRPRRDRRRGEVGFTPGQQGKFRPLVEQAWAAHCRQYGHALTPSLFPEENKRSERAEDAAFRSWYEDELEHCTGNRTTKECDRKRDFEAAMAHFEQIAGASIYWQTRVYGADARRIAWNIQELCRSAEVDEEYMRGVARRMLRLDDADPLPPLEGMSYQELIIIMGEVKRFLRRGGRPHVHQREAF